MKNISFGFWRRSRVPIFLFLGLLFCASSAYRSRAAEAGFNPELAQQIAALLNEKETRTPAQRKLDSHLLYAIRLNRNEPLAPGILTLKLAVTPDANGRVLVDIRGEVTEALKTQIRQAGELVGSWPQYKALRANLPLNSIEGIAGSPDITSIARADLPQHDVGRLTTEGDVTHRVNSARTNFNVMGEGVKIGVMSDSVDNLANSQASGDLPFVTVLPNRSGVPGSGEGTAMLEIVSDLVPKAQLFFSTAGGSPFQMAQNIIDLRLAGCDVQVDDIIFGTESPFQDGIIAQAVNAVTADGGMYFASGGNRGSKKKGTSSTYEGEFKSGGSLTLSNRTGLAHDFGANTLRNVVPIDGGFASAILQWADPLGRSTNDYDLFIVDSNGTTVVSASTTVQNGNSDPIEDAGFILPGQAAVILLVSGEARFMHLEQFNGGRWTFSTGGSTRGHNSASNAFGCAAVPVATAFPNAYTGGAANPVADFSSDGPRRMFFDPQGNAFTPGNFTATGGVVRVKPDIAAATGVKTTVPGFNPFFGTSASAPHAAAMAALLKSYNPSLTPAQIRAAFTNTTLDIEDPGVDPNSGWGILNPFAALASVPAPLPVLVSSNLSGGNGNGVIDPNECNELDFVLKNNSIFAATSVAGTLTTTTPGVTVVVGTSQYPSMPPGGTAVNILPFRIYTSQAFVCGTPVDLVFNMSSSLGGLTTPLRFTSGMIGPFPVSFTNSTVTAIPDNSTNGVDVLLPVSNITGPIGKVNLAVHVLHPAAGELELRLTSPDNTTVILAFHRGGTDPNYGLSCTQPTIFDRAAATNIASAFAPFVGSFRPQQSLTAFNGKSGTNVNGNWRLTVLDDQRLNTGAVQCASISLFPALCSDGGGDCSADVAVTIADAPDPVLVGSNLTYTVTITNRSTHIAPGTTLVDTLPPGVSVVSLASSRGSCSASAGSVNCALGSLPGNGSATVVINVRPPVAGLITNRATVTSIAMDTNPFDNNATAVTTVQNAMPILVPFATSLVSESGPINGGVDPGETLTINFYLRNIGTLDTTNLIVKLLSTGGVMDPSDQQNYGILVAHGPAVARPFTFQAIGTNGGSITATFQLQEGTNNGSSSLGTATFAFAFGGATTLANQSVIKIPDVGATNPYPSSIPVSGLLGVVSKVTVTLSNLNHTFPTDIDALLVGPAGQKVMLMSDVGASIDVVNAVLNFDDAGPLIPSGGPVVSGTFHPTDYPTTEEPAGDVLPAPAPPGPYAVAMSVFNGFDPNGTWALYVSDDFAGDSGRITGGWSLSITTYDPVNPQAELAVAVSDSPDPVMLDSNVTYTVTVTNAGPEVALDVVLTNSLPPGMTFVSSAGPGACSNFSGVVICSVGILNASNSAVFTVVATASGLGSQTFTAQVAGGVAEFNLADNTASATTAIQANADVAISIAASPSPSSINGSINYILTVTNQGPNNANGVMLTNVLPASVTYVAAGASQGGCSESGGTVTCALGSIPSHGQATVLIIVNTPANVTPLTDVASVGSTSPVDLQLANNQATLTTTNLNPAYIIIPAMTFLVFESGPTNGGIDVDETVFIDFELRNIGALPTTSLVGTLLPTGGVTSPGAPRTYGVLNPSGAAVGATFSFTAAGVPGDLITATIHLQDGPVDLGDVSFSFPLGNQSRFASTTPAVVPIFGPAALYPSTINISGLTGAVTKVSVTLSNLNHTYPDDLDILVVGPGGRSAMLMSDAGGGNGVSGLTLTFDDDAASSLPDRFAILPGTYRPTDYDDADLLPPPAPAGPYQTSLGVFNGLNPNGTWRLYVYDDTFSDQGQLAGGWSLDITTVGLIDPAPSLLVAGRFSPAGQFEFMLHGPAGGKFLIQRSPDMRSWSTIGNTVLAPSNTIMFTDPSPASPGPRFYRAVHMP